jgi:hypothetical protein
MPSWLRRIRITDNTLRTAGMMAGFFMAFHGLKIRCEWFAWFAGGAFLLWFFWPPRRGV